MFHALWRVVMKNKSGLLNGILSGMASSTTVYAPTSYPRLKGSDQDRMRGDVERVGREFNKVISNEQEKRRDTK
jgi:hypothetical protein